MSDERGHDDRQQEQRSQRLLEREPEMGWIETLGEHASNPDQPRKTGEAIFALGQEWTVSEVENRIKAQFEQWVRQGAKQAAVEIGREDGPEAERLALDAYMTARAARKYQWDGQAVRDALSDVPGSQYLLYLCLRRCHPDMTEELARSIFLDAASQVGRALGWALGNLQPPKTGAKKTAKEPPTTLDAP